VKERTLTLAGTEGEFRALLRCLQHCVGCGGLAEVVLAGRPRCVACAVPHRRARCTPLPHAALALRIEDALSPHIPSPRKRG
jgi:hypothetical protein